jgi:hypothetical protein
MRRNPLTPTSARSAGPARRSCDGFLTLCLLLFGLAALPTSSLRAEEENPPPPSFFIEEIRIEGIRQISEGILLAESRLQAGMSYGEIDLLKAIYRIHRLPFVLDATFSLRKGSMRGLYVLNVSVEETRSLFYYGELVAQESNLDSATDIGLIGVVGWRHFIRRAEMLFAAVDTDGIQAGYSHYDLFGKGLFFNLSYSRNGCCLGTIFPLGLEPVETIISDASSGSELGQVIVGIPLRHSQSIFFSASQEEFDNTSLRQKKLALSWVRDTSDDPFFPTRGIRILTQLQTTDFNFHFNLPLISADGSRFEVLEQSSSLTASSTQHWPIGNGHAISVIIQGGLGRSERRDARGSFESSFFTTALGARFSANLLGQKASRQWNDLRWETNLLYQLQTTLEPRSASLEGTDRSAKLSTSLALRHDWGILRLGFVYVWYDVERLAR